MGKGGGAIAGGFAMDRAIAKGVGKGQAAYDQAMGTLSAGKRESLGFLSPYTDVGGGALSPLSALLTGRSYDPETGEFTDLSPEERFASFEASPGYQFRVDEGMRSIQNSQAARGNILSGGALKELSQYNQGLASDEYSNYINNLMGLSQIGQASAGQSANIAGDVAGQIGQAQVGRGNITMQGRIARGQNQASTFSTVGAASDEGAQKAGGVAQMAASDRNLKQNIVEIGKSEDGITIYHFDYKDKKHGEGRYEGVMAQDLLESNPEAVFKKDGHLVVDYSKIDINFRRI